MDTLAPRQAYSWALALWTNPKKLQPMRDARESVPLRDPNLQFGRETFLDFDYFRTARADKVMVVAVIPFPHQFEPRYTVAQIEAFDHPGVFQDVQGTINRRQIAEIAPVSRKRLEDFLARHRVTAPAQDVQNRLAWTGHFADVPAQSHG